MYVLISTAFDYAEERALSGKFEIVFVFFRFHDFFSLVREIYHNFYGYDTLWHEKLNSRIFYKVPTSIWRISETKLAFQLIANVNLTKKKSLIFTGFHMISRKYAKILHNSTVYTVWKSTKYKTRSRSKISVKSTL